MPSCHPGSCRNRKVGSHGSGGVPRVRWGPTGQVGSGGVPWVTWGPAGLSVGRSNGRLCGERMRWSGSRVLVACVGRLHYTKFSFITVSGGWGQVTSVTFLSLRFYPERACRAIHCELIVVARRVLVGAQLHIKPRLEPTREQAHSKPRSRGGSSHDVIY